jgi:hypothetical protein
VGFLADEDVGLDARPDTLPPGSAPEDLGRTNRQRVPGVVIPRPEGLLVSVGLEDGAHRTYTLPRLLLSAPGETPDAAAEGLAPGPDTEQLVPRAGGAEDGHRVRAGEGDAGARRAPGRGAAPVDGAVGPLAGAGKGYCGLSAHDVGGRGLPVSRVPWWVRMCWMLLEQVAIIGRCMSLGEIGRRKRRAGEVASIPTAWRGRGSLISAFIDD